MKTELEKLFETEFSIASKIPIIKDIGFECFKRGFFKGKEYEQKT